MFLLLPPYFNSKLMYHDMSDTYSVSFPVDELEKFEDPEELDTFLLGQYYQIFFDNDLERTQDKYEFFMKKRMEEQLIRNLTKKE